MSSNRIVFTVTLGELAEVPGTPFAYWAPKSLRDLFLRFPPLDRDVARQPNKPKVADVKQGLATADDLRFTRYWWEVPVAQIATSCEETLQGKKWVPFENDVFLLYFTGGLTVVVNWGNNGEEIRNFPKAVIRNESFYFRPGLAWSASPQRSQMRKVNRWKRMPYRILPKGCIFGVAAQGIVAPDNDRWWLLALLVSKVSYSASRVLGVDKMPGTGFCACLPIAYTTPEEKQTLSFLSREAHDLLREWATGDETATVFVAPWILQVWWRLQGRGDADLLPVTGHPLAADFAWSDWESAKKCRTPSNIALTNRSILRPLAEACVQWETSVRQRLEEIQQLIDDEVYRLYGIPDEDRAQIEATLALPMEEEEAEEEEGTAEGTEVEEEEEAVPEGVMPPEEHIKRLVHYLAHEAIKTDPDGIVPLSDIQTAARQLERGLEYRVREQLRAIFGEERWATVEQEISQALGKSLGDWLATDFFSYHVGLYRLRPIIWQIVSRQRGKPAFSCFIYWHKLDADTLHRVYQVYLHPALEGARREKERRENQWAELKSSREVFSREAREVERAYQQALDRYRELEALSEKIQRLLQPLPEPQALPVQSRSQWVKEKVHEIVRGGYRPNRDYGVRVNIEPLKQAGILPTDAAKVRG